MKKYDFAILTAGCLWGIIGLFTRKLISLGISTSGILIIRSGGCAVFFALAILLKDPKLFFIRLRDFWLFFCFGVLSTLFFTYCYYQSISLSSLSVACTLMYCAPIFVTVISVFLFKEKFTVQKFTALVCAIAGCCLVSGFLESDSVLSTAGVVYGLLAGLGYGMYSILSKVILTKGYSVLTINFYGWSLCCLGGIILWGTEPASPMLETPGNILLCVSMVFVSGFAPAFLYNWGLKCVEAGKGSVMASVEPVVASIVGFAVFGEKPTLLGLLGIALVLGAVVILNVGPHAKIEPQVFAEQKT